MQIFIISLFCYSLSISYSSTTTFPYINIKNTIFSHFQPLPPKTTKNYFLPLFKKPSSSSKETSISPFEDLCVSLLCLLFLSV